MENQNIQPVPEQQISASVSLSGQLPSQPDANEEVHAQIDLESKNLSISCTIEQGKDSKASLKELKKTKKSEIQRVSLAPFNISESEYYPLIQKNKYIKLVFQHFCKNNQLKTVRSSTFAQKEKIFHLMDLNKWMIFCKEFELNKFLIGSRLPDSQNQLKNSPSKFVISAAKIECDRSFTNIFKKVSDHSTEMDLICFMKGLTLLYEILYQPKSKQSFNQYKNKVLHCDNEKSCLDKLSSLKIKFATPKLCPQKPPLSKQNLLIKSSKGDKVYYKLNQARFQLNKIVSSAKHETFHEDTKSCTNQISKLRISTQKQNQLRQIPSKFMKYLSSGRDDILDNYLRRESMLNPAHKNGHLKKK